MKPQSHRMTTYSIVGFDPHFQEIGVAVQSKFLAVGSLVPHIEADVGAVATQARTNTRLASMLLSRLKAGCHPKQALEIVTRSDDDIQERQLGLVDKTGVSVAFTGEDCLPYAGHIRGRNFVCLGNCLQDRQVLKKMANVFEKKNGDLGARLLAALAAGQEAGGDIRGQQSAALVIHKRSEKLLGQSDKLIDIRVDDHEEPLKALGRLFVLHRFYYATNYRDRLLPFDAELLTAIFNFECSVRRVGKTAFDLSEYKDRIERKVREIKPDLDAVFTAEYVSGEAIDTYMTYLYSLESDLKVDFGGTQSEVVADGGLIR